MFLHRNIEWQIAVNFEMIWQRIYEEKVFEKGIGFSIQYILYHGNAGISSTDYIIIFFPGTSCSI